MSVCIKTCIPAIVFPLSFMDYQKSIKLALPLGQLFPAGVANILSRVLKPLVGKSHHHVQSTSDFVNRAKKITLQLGDCLTSYDVTALFTSVPIDPVLNIIKDLLEKDEKLQGQNCINSTQHHRSSGILSA